MANKCGWHLGWPWPVDATGAEDDPTEREAKRDMLKLAEVTVSASWRLGWARPKLDRKADYQSVV